MVFVTSRFLFGDYIKAVVKRTNLKNTTSSQPVRPFGWFWIRGYFFFNPFALGKVQGF